MITDDRRAFKRSDHKFMVKYNLHGSDSPVSGTAVTENVSGGGAYFLSIEKLEIGQLIDCYIDMPGITERGKWKARVVRCERSGGGMLDTYGIAVEFVESFGNSEKNLKKLLDKKK